jgi:ComF family protein
MNEHWWRLVELLWPIQCAGCGTGGTAWCESCDAAVVPITNPACPGCKRLTGDGRYCPRCRKRTALTGILAGAHYRPPLDRAIKALKYRHAKGAVPALAAYQIRALARLASWGRLELVPVPLHRARQRRRGANQAETLCRIIAKATGLPHQPGLKRIRNTPSQTGLSRTERRANVAEAFRWSGPLPASTVVLVDDVATTGATLSACAAACRAAGARQVWGLVVAIR